MSVGKLRSSGLALAWMTVLAAGMFAWLGAPDIPVSETSGNGCGRWNGAELSLHRKQLVPFLLLPLLIADGIAATWIVMRRADLKKFGVVATSGLAWVLTWLWQPANVAYVWSQLLSVIVVPAVVLALLIWSAIAGSAARQRSEPLPRGTLPVLALVPPFAFITLVLWTRTPWIWTC
ncbi:hypothetical protein DVA67_025315 [Solirubrobacter sp. CPCC 204708]|uniref:Tryptophan-rich sensory protein n=1 Tax=Solirubrobacter deserti TaxID=2282478 RepID=A0ABT4RRJ5_9ACTN|nr:hypothetical protein [Solirubrobacter deserti]MBE2319321.1 hypothetical protein [Solirubrobacter deserti]MDA0141187.1 hypothetical protein [Solirubrobacter deserti]